MQATISLYENKQYDLEDKIRSLEEKSRLLEDRLAKAREESEAAAAGLSSKQAISAAEIDNETLTAQLKHFQNRVSVLEEELEEVRTQAEADGETWKNRLNKAKASEKAVAEKEREAREEVKKLERAANGAKTRIQEMGEALKENRGLLEVARAEIESMRVDVAVSIAVAFQAPGTDIVLGGRQYADGVAECIGKGQGFGKYQGRARANQGAVSQGIRCGSSSGGTASQDCLAREPDHIRVSRPPSSKPADDVRS